MKNLSIFCVIGKNPDEYYDPFRIGSYFPLSNAFLLNSISHLFYDLDKQHFQIFGIGQKKSYMLFQQTNNKLYFQLGNEKDEFYKISSDQDIDFHLFQNIGSLFVSLIDEIDKCLSKNVLIIFQDHESLYKFSNYYIYL